MPCYGQIGPYGSQGKAEAQDQVTKRGKPLGIAIAQHYGQCHGGQKKADPVNKKGSRNKEHAVHDSKGQRILRRNDPPGYFPDGSTRVERIKTAVEITVEGHGRTPGEHHAEEDKEELNQVKNPAVRVYV